MSSLLCVFGAALAAAEFEGPGSFTASRLLPPQLIKGPHFQVKEPVATPGYFHEFQIGSDFGDMQAEGHSLLLIRLNEIDALARLDDMSKTEVFVKAAGNSVLKVGKGVASVVSDPGGTAKGMGAGVKRFGTNLGRKAKRATDSGDEAKPAEGAEKSGGEKAADAGSAVAKSALGVNAGMRKWAQKLEVDPYTTNAVLRKALEDVAQIDAAGNIAAKVVVPIPGVVGATASVGGLVWGQDPEALLKLNEQRVAELGTEKKAAAAFLKNANVGLGYQTRLLAALYAVKAKGCGAYVDAAADSDSERMTVFFTESAEMLQRLHQGDTVEAVLPDSRAMIAKTRAGRAVALLPLDSLRWTEAFAAAVTEAGRRAKQELGATSLEIRLTGKASDRAKQELKTLGWAVVDGVPGSIAEPKAKAAGSPQAK